MDFFNTIDPKRTSERPHVWFFWKRRLRKMVRAAFCFHVLDSRAFRRGVIQSRKARSLRGTGFRGA